MNQDQEKEALQYIQEADEARHAEIEEFSEDKFEESDEDSGSEHPIFDIFYEANGDKAIISMVNFTRNELNTLYNRSEKFLKSAWTKRRGNTSSIPCFDMLFITLKVCKVGGTWEHLPRLFRMESSAFQRAVTSFVRLFEMDFYVDYGMQIEETFTMSYVAKKKRLFTNFPYARYATSVLFLQGEKPLCSLEDGKKYYSGKHKLYGQKIEVSVISAGVAINSTDPSSGSVADLATCQQIIAFHEKALARNEDEKSLDGIDDEDEDGFDFWAVLFDKGYVGMDKYLRCVVGKKSPQNGFLSFRDSRRSRSIASDRVLVGNYFGRTQNLWTLIASKRSWERSNLRMFFRFVLAMTNYHVLENPLRREDGEFFRKAQKRLYNIGLNAERKRKECRSLAYKKRKTKALADISNTANVEGGNNAEDTLKQDFEDSRVQFGTEVDSDENTLPPPSGI